MVNIKFPNNFIFGTAVASYQVEGGIYNNDWTAWENNKNSKCEEQCGEACKHYELIDTDINLLKTLGIKAFRFSIEWSRVEPSKNNFDEKEIKHYIDKTKKLLSENILPIITFHHLYLCTFASCLVSLLPFVVHLHQLLWNSLTHLYL